MRFVVFFCRNISHICSGWTWLMPSTKVWSASSFLTLWVWFWFPSARLHSVIPCCSCLLIISALFALFSLFSSPGLRWLWRGSVYMGNSHHHPRFIHHSGALGHWDQNLGKEPNFKVIYGKSPRFLRKASPLPLLLLLTEISFLALWALVRRLTGPWIFNSSWLDWTRKLCSIRDYISAWQRVCLRPGLLETPPKYLFTTPTPYTYTHTHPHTYSLPALVLFSGIHMQFS